MSEPDELYTLRNLFWLGNFQVKLYLLIHLFIVFVSCIVYRVDVI